MTLKSGLEVTQGHWNWCHSKAWVRFPIRLFVIIAVSEAILEIWWKNYDDMLSRFHTIAACHGQTDGRTDGQTELLYQYRASAAVCWRPIKINNLRALRMISGQTRHHTGLPWQIKSGLRGHDRRIDESKILRGRNGMFENISSTSWNRGRQWSHMDWK